jgi:hypothetical protein
MRLEQDLVEYIKNIVDAANVAKLMNVSVEKGLIRGIDESKRVIVWHDQNVPALPFTMLGLNRFEILTPRLGILYDQPNFTVDATISERDSCVSILTMKAPGSKVDFRCANPKTLMLPKSRNDTMAYQVEITPESVQFLLRSEAAMKMDLVTFVSNESGVKFEIVDNNGDVLSHTFAEQVENVTGGSDTTFVGRYPLRVVLSLFKKATNGIFTIGQRGMMKVTVCGLDLYILPQV